VDSRILSTPVAGGFVGAYIGIYASSNGQLSTNHADFDWFEYIGLDE
jgi:alpha-N-arabinofuranosidase